MLAVVLNSAASDTSLTLYTSLFDKSATQRFRKVPPLGEGWSAEERREEYENITRNPPPVEASMVTRHGYQISHGLATLCSSLL